MLKKGDKIKLIHIPPKSCDDMSYEREVELVAIREEGIYFISESWPTKGKEQFMPMRLVKQINKLD